MSSDIKNLKSPPIAIAIAEIRFRINNPDLKIERLLEANKEVANDYPLNRVGRHRNIHIKERNDGKPIADITADEVREYAFFDRNKVKAYTVSLDRFNFTQNGHYESWEQFTAEAKRLWDIYSKLLKEVSEIQITGISTRFINKIEVNDIVESPAEYFNTTIYANEDVLPGSVSSYLIRYVAEKKEEGINVVVTQGLDSAVQNNFYPFIFDIDVIYTLPLKEEELWGKFDRLRDIKNETFFSNLTEKTLNLYK